MKLHFRMAPWTWNRESRKSSRLPLGGGSGERVFSLINNFMVKYLSTLLLYKIEEAIAHSAQENQFSFQYDTTAWGAGGNLSGGAEGKARSGPRCISVLYLAVCRPFQSREYFWKWRKFPSVSPSLKAFSLNSA